MNNINESCMLECNKPETRAGGAKQNFKGRNIAKKSLTQDVLSAITIQNLYLQVIARSDNDEVIQTYGRLKTNLDYRENYRFPAMTEKNNKSIEWSKENG